MHLYHAGMQGPDGVLEVTLLHHKLNVHLAHGLVHSLYADIGRCQRGYRLGE